jgi:hypothetical protein
MIVIKAPTEKIRAGAFTLYPFVFVSPTIGAAELEWLLVHEGVHYKAQRAWLYWGLPIGLGAWYAGTMFAPACMGLLGWGLTLVPSLLCGLIAWLALYELVLPVGWNPFRWRWEHEAHRVARVPEEYIAGILRRAPYFLFWM